MASLRRLRPPRQSDPLLRPRPRALLAPPGREDDRRGRRVPDPDLPAGLPRRGLGEARRPPRPLPRGFLHLRPGDELPPRARADLRRRAPRWRRRPQRGRPGLLELPGEAPPRGAAEERPLRPPRPLHRVQRRPLLPRPRLRSSTDSRVRRKPPLGPWKPPPLPGPDPPPGLPRGAGEGSRRVRAARLARGVSREPARPRRRGGEARRTGPPPHHPLPLHSR